MFSSKHVDWHFGDAIIDVIDDMSKHTDILERLFDDDSDEPLEASEKVMALIWIFSFPTVMISILVFKRYRNERKF